MPSIESLADLGVREAAERIRRGEVSSAALTEACLARVTALEPQILAWAHLDREGVTIRMNLLRQVFAEILAPAIRHQQCQAEDINSLIICRIDPDLAEVERPRVNVARPGPFLAPVF